jgi:hypothetical protein
MKNPPPAAHAERGNYARHATRPPLNLAKNPFRYPQKGSKKLRKDGKTPLLPHRLKIIPQGVGKSRLRRASEKRAYNIEKKLKSYAGNT